MSRLLEVEGLHVSYGRVVALDGVDLVVPEGSIVALLGPNGAGKSTLLRAVAGLVTPRAGTVRLAGDVLDDLSPHERATRGLCLIPEGRGVFPALTVSDNLRVALDDDVDALARVIEFFPVLASRREQAAGTLSGGEQQMLALARAVGASQTLLLADEPSLGLAPLVVKLIVETIERLNREMKRTVLLVEQYATHALRLADVVYILNHGAIAWAGEPAELRGSKVLADSYLGG